MDAIVFEVRLTDGRIRHVVAWFSDNEAAAEGCDACIGWSMHEPGNRREIDGGEMDYDSREKDYVAIGDAMDDLVGFIGDDFGATVESSRISGADPEDYLS